jgi:hypothetical protein
MLLGEALLVALTGSGWTVEGPLGEPVTACRDGERLVPHEVVETLRSDAVATAGWPERASALGIAELPLRPHVLAHAE